VPHFAARNLLLLRVLRLVASLTRVFVRFVVFQSQFIPTVVGSLEGLEFFFFSRDFFSSLSSQKKHTAQRLRERVSSLLNNNSPFLSGPDAISKWKRTALRVHLKER
jgi:hypothetical protein